MKKKITPLKSKEFDAGFLLYKLWREKYLILAVTFSCLILMYVFILNLKSNLRTEIEISTSTPASQFFDRYKSYFNIIETTNEPGETEAELFINFYMKDFNLNLKSREVLNAFTKHYYLNENFKNFIKKNDTSVQIFSNEIISKNLIGRDKKKNNRYYFLHPKEMDGEEFLTEYIKYVSNVTLADFSKKIQSRMKNRIKELSDALVIAEGINLQEPVIDQQISASFTVPNRELFYLGSKVLKIKIKHHKRELESIYDSYSFDNYNYVPTLSEAFVSGGVAVQSSFYYFAAVMLGLSLSFVIIIIRFLVRPYLK